MKHEPSLSPVEACSRFCLHAIIIFPDLPEVVIEQVQIADEIMLTLRTTSPTASCPKCGTRSTRVQSRYTRRLHDLPSGGRPVCLMLHVRRFFCTKSSCAQKIFTKRLPELCRPHAQRTIQLQQALCQLGLASGREARREGNWRNFSTDDIRFQYGCVSIPWSF